MSKRIHKITRKFYKGMLLGVLAILSFMIKSQNDPGAVSETAYAETGPGGSGGASGGSSSGPGGCSGGCGSGAGGCGDSGGCASADGSPSAGGDAGDGDGDGDGCF